MSVRGFGVSNQERKRLRKPLAGRYHGHDWRIECEATGLFSWSAGRMSGFTPRGATVAIALKEIRDAVKLQEEAAAYGALSREKLDLLMRLKRWERLALQGRVKVQAKRRRRSGDLYFHVEEMLVS